MAKRMTRSHKIASVMGEFKAGKLKSPWGQRITNPRQAIAIALSMASRMVRQQNASSRSAAARKAWATRRAGKHGTR